jgi:hypothetical protein
MNDFQRGAEQGKTGGAADWNNSVEQKIWGLMQVWAEVKFNFVYFDQVPDLDWNSTGPTHRAMATAAAGRE